jgi:regulatory protein YycI of two-component signal transduction system YycFG
MYIFIIILLKNCLSTTFFQKDVCDIKKGIEEDINEAVMNEESSIHDNQIAQVLKNMFYNSNIIFICIPSNHIFFPGNAT